MAVAREKGDQAKENGCETVIQACLSKQPCRPKQPWRTSRTFTVAGTRQASRLVRLNQQGIRGSTVWRRRRSAAPSWLGGVLSSLCTSSLR